jgi:hypothetical protein
MNKDRIAELVANKIRKIIEIQVRLKSRMKSSVRFQRRYRTAKKKK